MAAINLTVIIFQKFPSGIENEQESYIKIYSATEMQQLGILWT